MVCVVGAGISGLSTAFHLAAHPDIAITVYEQEDHFGGRADVDPDGEHCPRFFMDDYVQLFAVLRQIKGADGESVFASLRPVRRFAHTPSSGWVEITHLYRILAKEIPLAERLRAVRLWRPSPLVAEQHPLRNANRYGSLRNFSFVPLTRMVANFFTSKVGYVLPGPTDEYLITPWVRHLRERGVVLRESHRVTRIGPDKDHVTVTTAAGAEDFDAVVVTAFVPDLVSLLDASNLAHTVVETSHTHCVAFTIGLDAREPVVAGTEPSFYCRDGLNILVQPEHRRCVVLCTRSPSTDAAYVLPKVRAFLGLRYEFTGHRTRPNQRPGEAVLVGDYLRAGRILRRPTGNVQLAGSYVHNSYPLDSAEGAARSALAAARRVLAGRAAGGSDGT
ncbi:MAG: hypothetical protein QOF98_1597 [Streptomyces sp.]|nr:hypothetical protein [Streptomyces sp.]